MRAKPEWEVVGAGSGLLATLAFIVSLIITLTTDPTGTPPLPALDNAEAAPAYIAANLNAFRLELLLLTLGTLLFLWFLASLSVSLRQAEGEPARGAIGDRYQRLGSVGARCWSRRSSGSPWL